MAIADDISVDINGNIRYTGSGTNYTVLELHRFLAGLSDDEQAVVDDLVDITSDTPSDRSTNQIVTLNSPYNIDDTLARHLYDGSITQDDGDTVYSGLYVVGTVVAGTVIMILQDNKILPSYWGTGINPDAANLVIMKILVKTRVGGADIDSKKILVLARELNDQYKEFPVTLGLANSTAAISTADDLNNNSSDATIEGWYGDILNTEGYQLLDIDDDGTGEEYYTKWDKGTKSLNDTYEYSKWVGQRSHDTSDTGEQTGTDYIVDNATIVGQGQEFTSNPQVEKLTEMRVWLKVGAGTPTGPLTMELYASDGGSPAEPTGGKLATSDEVLASVVTDRASPSTYVEVIFRFTDNYSMAATTDYFGVIRHPNGDASNYFQVRGDATGTGSGNQAEENPASTWTGNAAEDLDLLVKSSPVWFGMQGEQFRGPTHEVEYDNESGGPFTQNEFIFWGATIQYDTLVGGPFQVGEYVKFVDASTSEVINGGKVLKNTGSVLTVALEDIAPSEALADGDHITGVTSGATADIDTNINNADKAGGEGILLALDDQGVEGTVWIQLISGSAPVDDLPIEGRTSGTTADVDTNITGRTIYPEFIGQSTGANLIGAYGVGFDTNDVGSSDKFFDLTGQQRTPPNNVTFKVTGLVAGEDRVLVGPRTGTSLEKGQWLLDQALTGVAMTGIVVKNGAEAIPIATDTPAVGTGALLNSRLRVELNTGIYRRQDYNSYNDTTFAIPSTDYSGSWEASGNNDVFLAYVDVLASVDEEGFTAVYKGSDRLLFVRVRDGGATPIKTFESSAVFGDANSSVAAIRTSDA
jgi:hypothetical protein